MTRYMLWMRDLLESLRSDCDFNETMAEIHDRSVMAWLFRQVKHAAHFLKTEIDAYRLRDHVS